MSDCGTADFEEFTRTAIGYELTGLFISPQLPSSRHLSAPPLPSAGATHAAAPSSRSRPAVDPFSASPWLSLSPRPVSSRGQLRSIRNHATPALDPRGGTPAVEVDGRLKEGCRRPLEEVTLALGEKPHRRPGSLMSLPSRFLASPANSNLLCLASCCCMSRTCTCHRLPTTFAIASPANSLCLS